MQLKHNLYFVTRALLSCKVELQNLSHLYNACALLHIEHLSVAVEIIALVLRRSFICLSPLPWPCVRITVNLAWI